MDYINKISLFARELINKQSVAEKIALSKWYYSVKMKVCGLSSANLKKIISVIKKEIKTAHPELLSSIAGPAWRLGMLKDRDIIKWAKSGKHWWRRNALVATVGLNLKSQGGTGATERTLAICKKLESGKKNQFGNKAI